MSLLTEQEIIELCADNGLEFCPNWGTAFTGNTEIIRVVHAVEAKVIEKIKAQGPVAFEYNGEPWFDGNSWHEQKELTKDRKVAEFKTYLGKPPVPLYRLPEGD